MAKLRTFIAVDLPGEVVARAQRLCQELGEGADGIKWVEPQSMHLTLKFLGDVRENETYEICQAIDRAVGSLESFDVDCLGAGAFPNVERPRTLWIGIGRESEPLAQLHAAIEDAMADLGFHREPKRFLPHLTIGRVKRPGPYLANVSRLLAERADFDAGVASVDEVVLYASELAPEGPIYTPIGRTELH